MVMKLTVEEALAALNERFGLPFRPRCDAVAGVLLGPLRADADGADQLQSFVPLNRRSARGCAGVAFDGVHAQSRSAPASGSGARVPGGTAGGAEGERVLSSEHFSVDGTLIDA
jgi:hypothetical protein